MTETGSGVVYDGVGLQGVEVSLRSGEVFIRCPMLLRCYRDGTDPKSATAGSPPVTPASSTLAGDSRSMAGWTISSSRGREHLASQVEAVLRGHPSVLEVAVGGRPDPQWGARLVAYVVAAPEVQGAEPATILAGLRELVKQQLAPTPPRASS